MLHVLLTDRAIVFCEGTGKREFGAPMSLRTAIIIATRSRPQEVSNLLNTLALQTQSPDVIVVSACDHTDIEQGSAGAKNIEVLFGPPGLPAQRNRALSLVHGKYDIIIFFDDDFIPSRFWIERLQLLLVTQSDLVCVTGHVLIDGATTGGLEWSNGQTIVNSADSSRKMLALKDWNMLDDPLPYGCNMAFRAKSIEHLTFDERLVQYGWLEDRDFAFRAGTGGRMIRTDALWGVHLGTKRGRVPGLRFGYSQVVNPWYLMKKGSMRPSDVYRLIFRGLAGNTIGSFAKNSHIDRWGRLKGNIIGIKDIMFGRWAPERVAEL
jgi:GT2 family glycosyltransferase